MFSKSNISSIVDICLNSTTEQLQVQIDGIFTSDYGLDFLVDNQKQNVLHFLSSNPNFTNWDILLRCFVYLDVTDIHLQTPLFIAVQSRNILAIRKLIENNASPLIEDENGVNPIQLACKMNYSEGLKILLSVFQGKNYVMKNPIKVTRVCLENNAIYAFKIIISEIPSKRFNIINEDGLGIIHYVVLEDKIEFLKKLLKLNKDSAKNIIKINLKAMVNKTFKKPIELAKSEQIMEYLYANGAKISRKHKTSDLIDLQKRAENWQNTGKSYIKIEIHKAAIEGNVAFIKSYQGKKIDVVDSFNFTPLLYAIKYNKSNAISALLTKGANPNFYTGSTTAFLYAALHGNEDAFKILQGYTLPDLSIKDAKGRSLLSCALKKKNPVIIDAVKNLKKNLDEDSKEIAEALLEEEDEIGSAIFEIIYYLSSFKNIRLEDNKTFLHIAILKGHYKLAISIANFFKDTKINEYEPDYEECFTIAIRNEVDELVKLFIESGIIPLVQNYLSLLIFETVNHKRDTIKDCLLEKYPNIVNSEDQLGNTFLHKAALNNQTNSILYGLNKMKIDINSKNKQGNTPIHLLINQYSDNFKENLNILLENKADPTILNNKNQNILHICADNDNSQALDILFETFDKKMIDKMLAQKDDDNNTPLELSSKRYDYKCSYIISRYVHLPIFDSKVDSSIIEMYHKKHYSMNLFNIDGEPLLSYVINQKNIDQQEIYKTVQEILKFKANPSLEDAKGLTPLHYSILSGNKDIVLLLVNSGANFIVEPVITIFAKENEQKDIADLLKMPEKRASAINELVSVIDNAVPILGCISKNDSSFGNDIITQKYMSEVKYMHRLLTLFRERFHRIIEYLKASTKLGSLLLYFADAFLPLLEIAASYEVTISNIKSSKVLSPILKTYSGHAKLSFDDALIVPTQQFTYYPELIKAIIKATPQDHPDLQLLQKAHIKFSYIGRIVTEKKLIAESQKELRSIKLKTTIKDKGTKFYLDDILLCRGQFEKKGYTVPQNTGTRLSNSVIWGLRTYSKEINGLKLNSFNPFGSSMESFLNNQKISIILFKKTILFGVQKTNDKFKLKFSCKTSEVIWNFSSEYGNESVMLYVPFGCFLLKFSPPKSGSAIFERNRWRSEIDKLKTINESDLQSDGGIESCFVSWVGKDSNCVFSHLFIIKCSNKIEAKEKILDYLKQKEIPILYTNIQGKEEPLINFDFQTNKKNEGQKLNVISSLSI